MFIAKFRRFVYTSYYTIIARKSKQRISVLRAKKEASGIVQPWIKLYTGGSTIILNSKRQSERSIYTKALKCIIYFFSILTFTVAIYVLQGLFSQLASAAAGILSYRKIDPNGVFAEISVHHVLQALMALVIIIILKLFFKKRLRIYARKS